jgi:anti-repressor protein
MESQLKQFTAPCGAQLRILREGEQLFFVGKDAAVMLGYKDTVNAIKRFCRGVAKHNPIVDNLGRVQAVRVTNEPDFYRLVVNSKLPAAQEYERWVFEEVLPAIRRDGGYIAATVEETPEEVMARALQIAQATLERQKARIAELEYKSESQALELAEQDIKLGQQQLALEAAAPKVTFADAVAQSDNCILIGELAKLIRQNGIDMGMNRLFRWLRDNKYLMRDNRPTQRSMERGLFRVIERSIVDASGNTRLCLTTKVTGKGQQYFINLFLSNAV